MAAAREKPRPSTPVHGGRPVELPRHIAPMLAQTATEPFDSPEFLFEIKWDGIRCLALYDGTQLRLQSRRDLELRGKYPEFACLTGLPPGTVLDGEILGKPGDAATAASRWRAMRGSTGVLHTGHWLVDARVGHGPTTGATSSTTVHFADLTDEEIDAYVATGEPLQVAGAFTVDGLGGPYVEAIEGDYHGVVGVSLPLVRRLLGELGIAFHELRQPSPL